MLITAEPLSELRLKAIGCEWRAGNRTYRLPASAQHLLDQPGHASPAAALPGNHLDLRLN